MTILCSLFGGLVIVKDEMMSPESNPRFKPCVDSASDAPPRPAPLASQQMQRWLHSCEYFRRDAETATEERPGADQLSN